MSLRKFVCWLNVFSLAFNAVPTQALAAGLESLPKTSEEVVVEKAADDISAVVGDDETLAARVNADAVSDSTEVADVLVGLGAKRAQAAPAAASLLSAEDEGQESPEIPRQADGSNVEALSLWWITPDTVDNGDADLLYVKPTADEAQQVRMRLNYALSGEFDYQAGDIRITIPDKMFFYRDGSEAGTLVIPYPESPDSRQDFMWEHVGDTYVLTNTRRMSAATKGFMEFAFTGLTPHKLVDMQISDEFVASIDVTTHYGDLIGLTSNALTARFDTEQVVDAAYKRYVPSIAWVSADQIPESQRVAGEEEYVLVTWDVYGHHWGNTEFTLDVLDQVMDEYNGFVIGATSTDESGSRVYDDLESGWQSNGTFGHMTVRTAYPGSQFEPDTDYLFKNKVTYTLTEMDPTLDDDEQKVTVATAAASVPFRWHMPVFKDPEGHFMMNKIGNDGAFGRDSAPYWSRSYGYLANGYYKGLDVTHRKNFFDNTDDGFGIYTSALNQLQDGNSVEVAYTVESQGYMAPWQVDTTMDTHKVDAYGKKPVTMITYDTDADQEMQLYLDGGETLEWGSDWTYKAIEFPIRPDIGKLGAVNLDENGGFIAKHAGDGTFEYLADSDDSKQPVIYLDAYVGGEWKQVATARWTGSNYDFVCSNGAIASGRRILLPTGTERTRTRVTTTCAYLLYYVRPIIEVLPSEHVSSVVDGLFAVSNSPSIGLHNTAAMDALNSTGAKIIDFHKSGMDELRGYSTEIAVHPTKVGRQDLADIDFANHEITIHYTAKAEERSLIADRAIYDGAVEDGRIIPETHGVWRDLLPEGVYPLMDTIKVREGDTVIDAYTIENWRDSNRTMLVVECELTPSLTTYEYGSRYDQRLMDVPTLWFDALYSFEDLRDFGEDVHNVVSFESLAKDEIGSYPDWSGEADDPAGDGNIATKTAFLDDTERSFFEDLDEDRDTPSFVYAGVTTKIDALAAARTSLSKDIQVNNDGRWSQGTYDDHRCVYEGGQYSYRLRTMSDSDTETKDIVIYDALEAFHAGNGNDEVDIDAPRWRGYLRSIDLSQLEEMGVAPVVYYSTIPELQLSDETNALQANVTNTDLTKSNIWTRADQYTGNLDDVCAIAVDCSKRPDGTDFVLDEFESISFVVRMQAPSGEDARTYISQKGAWGDSAHAYNNAYMLCTSTDKNSGISDSANFVRKDYTKVGLMEYSYKVSKTWVDDRNRDGLRPDSIVLHLLADGEDTGLSCELSEDNGWASAFEHVPYTDPDGNKIRYSVSEDALEGYEFTSSRIGTNLYAINSHEYERTKVEGEKHWTSNGEEIPMPESIRVTALADGMEWETKTVTDDGSGTWKYSFDSLPKYRDGGKLIEWTLSESGVSPSFVMTTDGSDITNFYHPYGDLAITKAIHGVSAEFAGQGFPVMVMLTDDEGTPLVGTFEWDSTSGASGTMSSGDTLTIHGDETITIHEIPEYSAYEVIEADVDGYELVGDGLVGEIEPNACAGANLDNYYHAEGTAQVRIAKTLTGRDMERYQFRFELVDEEGNVVRTGANQANGSVVFGAINYTEADAGKTYHYTIREVDRGVGGYTYDDATYDVAVAVTDLGNGRIKTETTITDKDGETVAVPTFDNTYHAEGSVKLRAWKRLLGDTLANEQFDFVVEDASGTKVAEGTNNAAGDVFSDEIEFDETDAGQTYLYVMYEDQGDDAKMIYDQSAFGYLVEVTDDGQGHMLTTQEYVAVQHNGDGWVVDEETDAVVPVFVNERVPGELDIEKTVAGEVPEGHENDEFTFRVKLVGENMPENISYELEEINPSTPTPEPTPTGVVLGSLWENLFGIRKAYAADAGGNNSVLLSSETYYASGGTFSDGESRYTRNARGTTSGDVFVSHTQNISDGNKTSNYGNYWSNANIRGTGRDAASSEAHVITVPGAKSVVVSVEYGGESTNYDWLRIWSGSHPNYTAETNESTDLVAERLGGQHGSATYVVEGDTVTFAFRSDVGGVGDGFGYYATVASIDSIVADDVPEPPTRDGYAFVGWNTRVDGTGKSVSDEFSSGSCYAQWIRTDVTYEANGGVFADGSESNNVTYRFMDVPAAVSHTDNVDDSGMRISDIATSYWYNEHVVGTGREQGDSSAHVVTIPGADRLFIDIEYGVVPSNLGVCVWQGAKPDARANNSSGSISGVLGQSGHKTYVIDGDTATFAFYSHGNSTPNSEYNLGYYATIHGLEVDPASSYEVPTRDGHAFMGWNSKADGSGTDSLGTTATLYAQWENLVTTYDANGGTFSGGASQNVVTYDMISRAQVSHTANVDDNGHMLSTFDASGNSYIRGTNRTSSNSYSHILSIPGAERTRLTVEYGTGGSQNKVTAVSGSVSTSNSTYASSAVVGVLYGPHRTKTIDLDTDSVSFMWYAANLAQTGDGYGYYAVLDYPREAVEGTYVEPTRDGYRFIGWDTAADGSDGVSHVSGGTLYAQWEEVESGGIVFDANGGTFDDGTTSYESGSTSPFVYEVVKSDNRSMSGMVERSYKDDFDSGHTYETKHVKIPVVDSLLVALRVGVSSYDAAYVIRGNYQGDFARPNGMYSYPSDVPGQVRKSTSSGGSYRDTVASNELTFALFGYGYYSDNALGYYATIMAPGQVTAKTPEREHYRFVGWNTSPDGSGNAWCDGSGTMYAQWELIGGECGGVSWAINEDNSLVFWPTNGVSGTFERPENGYWPWLKYLDSDNGVSSVYAEPGVIACEDMSHFLDRNHAGASFATSTYNTTVKSVDLSNMDVSNVKDMSYMFSRLEAVESIDIESWDTSKVENFAYWLSSTESITLTGSTKLSVNLSELDLDSAKVLDSMFANRLNTYRLDLSALDTHNAESMYNMFYRARFCPDDLAAWDVSNVTDMRYMFEYAKAVDREGKSVHDLPFGNWDVSNVTRMDYMFYGWSESSEPIELHVDNWDTSNVTNMSYMFCGNGQGVMNPVFCDLSKLEVGSVQNFGYMLYLNDAFKVVDISNWDMSSATYTAYMIGTSSAASSNYASNHGSRGTVKIVFGEGCNLPSNNSVYFSGQSMDGKWRRIDETDEDRISGNELGKLSNAETGDRDRFVGTWVASKLAAVAVLDSDGNLTFVEIAEPILEQDTEHTDITVTSVGGTQYTGHVDVDYICNRSSYRVYLFDDQRTDVKHVSVDEDSTVEFAYNTGLYRMFENFVNMESFDGARFDTSGQTTFHRTFKDCNVLTDIDVSTWDTANVTDMSNTFTDCNVLPELDLSSWDVSSVTTMSQMFSYCRRLATINTTGWDTSNVKNMNNMFYYAYDLDASFAEDFDVSNVTDFHGMFAECDGTKSLDLSGWNTSSATNINGMFYYAMGLESLNLSGWDTSNVTSSGYSNNTGIGTSSSSDGASYLNNGGLFYHCSSLKELDLSGWDTTKFNSYNGMFGLCTSLEKLDISSFSNMDNSKYRASMFEGSSNLREVTLGEGFDFTRSDNPTNTSYNAVLPTPPTATTTGRWVNLEKDATNALTPAELRDSYDGSDESMTGTWVWELAQKLFSFDGNGGMGRMSDYGVTKNVAGKLPPNSFTLFDHDFVGWNTEPDGSGESFDDEAIINYTANEWQRVRLYAQWQQRDHTVDVEDGTFLVSIPAGYRIKIADLPAGTSYVVTEVSTSSPGWVVSDSSNTTGVIVSDETTTARFENRYVPNEARVTPMAYKTLDGLVPENGAFTFRLLDSENAVVDEKTCGASGAIIFDDLVFDAAGEHDYKIVEVAGNDNTIDYDDSEVAVHVSVTERDGVLSARMTYDGAATTPTFANTHKPGELTVTKSVSGPRAAGANDSFDVVVTLTRPDGLPMTSVTVAGESTPRVSDTGTYVVSLTGGASAKFMNLPAHTKWAVSEPNVGAGWTLDGITNATGEVESAGSVTSTVSNVYAASGEATIQAHKRLVGRGLTTGEFGFELLDADDNVIERVWSGAVDERETIAGADGETEVVNPYVGTAPVTFTALSYDEPGTYHYTVCEVAGDDPTITYSDEVLAVTVEVVDAGRGQLSTSVTFDGAVDTFENLVRTGSLVVEKHVSGATEAARGTAFDVTLELKDANNVPVANGSYDAVFMSADGSTRPGSVNVSGGVATLRLAGSESVRIDGLAHGTRYRVFETGLEPCWSVVAESATTGSVVADDEVTASITNGYTTSGTFALDAVKTVVDLELKDGDYRFEVTDDDGRVVASASNVGGSVHFDGIEIDPSWVGITKTFHVRERAGNNAAVLYDDHVEDVTATFADDGHGHLSAQVTYDADGCSFENVHNPGWLRVAKTSAVEGIVGKNGYELGGATFEVVDATGTVVARLTSDDEGLTEEVELDPGAYTVRETGAPSGFVVNTSFVRGQVTGGKHVTVTVVDEPVRGSVKVTKQSARPETTGGKDQYDLGGATYAVFDTKDAAEAALEAALAGTYADGGFEPIAEIVLEANEANTEATGTAKDLLMGTYWVVEVVPGTRYRIAEEVWEVAVTGGETYTIGEDGIVYDMPNSGYLEIEKLLGI